MTFKKLTPVIPVEAVEPCLPFWERLGFAKTVEVPEGDPSAAGGSLGAGKLGFVILVKDGVEVMYQSRASIAKDFPALAQGDFRSNTTLFIEVQGLDEIIAKLKGVEVVVPERKTFYGSREIGGREPGGSLVVFAEFEQAKK